MCLRIYFYQERIPFKELLKGSTHYTIVKSVDFESIRDLMKT